jgi:hypothetical protein
MEYELWKPTHPYFAIQLALLLPPAGTNTCISLPVVVVTVANALPSWCQGMISACEERATSFANSTEGTKSQCRAYCNVLQIENCNGGSSTVLRAARACTAGAERDQKEAARQDAIRKQAENEHQQAENARRERENYVPPGWAACSCPADHMYEVASGRAKLVNGVLYHGRDVGSCD